MVVLNGAGIQVGNGRAETLKEPLEVLPAGERLILPVCPVAEQESWTLPAPGTRVNRLVPLATETSGTRTIFPPVPGEVTGTCEKELPNGKRMLCVTMKPDSEADDTTRRQLVRPSRQQPSAKAVLNTVESMGIVDEIDGRPLAQKLAGWIGSGLETLVCDAVCDDPYNTDSLCALREATEDAMKGLELAARICGCEKTLVITYRKFNLGLSGMRRLRRAMNGQKSMDITGKYPIWPKLSRNRKLLPLSFGRIGVQACIRLNRAVYLQRPPERCIITVAGDGLTRSRNFSAVLGTPVSAVLAYCEKSVDETKSVVVHSTLTGCALTDLDTPVQQDTRCILALADWQLARTHACISCGKCNEVCCEAVFVSEALRMLLRKEDDRALTYGADRCIGCGACSAACPSGIPISAMMAGFSAKQAEKAEK